MLLLGALVVTSSAQGSVICFGCGNDICRVSPDGSGRTQVTSDGDHRLPSAPGLEPVVVARGSGSVAPVQDLDTWWAGGRRLPGGVFTRADGPDDAPAVTWLHGFPTSSWDWAPLQQALGASRRDITLDFLGFGASAKPRGHDYSLLEQADLVEAVWEAHGVTETALVAHDYGVSVAQELLARRGEDRLQVTLTAVTFLNGGIFPRLHRPIRIQTLMVGPLGPLLARLTSERRFAAALREVMAVEPDAAELHEHWRAFSRDHGNRNINRLLSYMAERRVHEQRWVGALLGSGLPTRFVWGPEDPVSGAHVLPEIRSRMPAAAVHVLEGVGHYPQLEATGRVAAAFTSG